MKPEEQQQIQQFREAFKNLLNTTGTGQFHPADIRRIEEDDFFCRWYVRAGRGSTERAMELATKALEWRKSMGVNDFDEVKLKASFFLGVQSLYPYGVTKTGSHILVMRSKNHRKPRTPEEALEHTKLFTYVLEQMIVQKGARRITLMFDAQEAGISNLDMDGIKFIISVFRDYYPTILESIMVVDIPWVLQAAWKIIKGLMPAEAQKIIIFLSKKDLQKYIDPENLPKWLNGTNEYCYKYVPGNVLGDFCPQGQKA